MVTKLATEHKELHGGISKVGKAIDRVKLVNVLNLSKIYRNCEKSIPIHHIRIWNTLADELNCDTNVLSFFKTAMLNCYFSALQ